MTVFEKLLTSVRKSNPDLITEQEAEEFVTGFNAEMDQIKTDAAAEGQAAGFKEGYEEGKKAAADEAKVKFDALVEKLDSEATDKLTKVIEMIDADHTKMLQEVYDKLTTEKEAAVQQALDKQDEDYANKFQLAMEAVDEKHANMLQKALSTVDEVHSKKLNNLYTALDKKHAEMISEAVNAVDTANAKKLIKLANICKLNQKKAVALVTESLQKKNKLAIKKARLVFESKLKQKDKALIAEQQNKLAALANSVDKYIDYALEQHLPKKQLIAEAKYNAAIKTIAKVTDILKVNAIIQESKDGIFADYESKIAAEQEAQQKLVNENIQLKAKINKQEAQIVLEEKCKDCTPSEAKFLRTYFKGATKPSIIEESVDEAKSAFRKLQSERRQSLIDESAKSVSKNPTTVVTESKKETVKESPKKIVSESKKQKTSLPINKPAKSADLMDIYASMLKGN